MAPATWKTIRSTVNVSMRILSCRPGAIVPAAPACAGLLRPRRPCLPVVAASLGATGRSHARLALHKSRAPSRQQMHEYTANMQANPRRPSGYRQDIIMSRPA
eukprot:6200864-Pleurochrysis_carterae.AAC.1